MSHKSLLLIDRCHLNRGIGEIFLSLEWIRLSHGLALDGSLVVMIYSWGFAFAVLSVGLLKATRTRVSGCRTISYILG